MWSSKNSRSANALKLRAGPLPRAATSS
jgi:hypothetical protein